eukprot:1119340-Amphidinium_carterae.1
MTCLDALLLALDPLQLGPPSVLRSLGRVGAALFALDPLSLGLLVSLKSFAQLGPAMLVLDLVTSDAPLFLQGGLQGGSSG